MLVSAAIAAGFREANITVLGAEPTAAEQTEALAALNSYWRSMFGNTLGENLEDWPVPNANVCPPPSLVSPDMSTTWYLTPRTNSRLLLTLTAATSVRLPEAPNDGSRIALIDVGSTSAVLTLHGNGRLIDGQPYLLTTAQEMDGKLLFYRADLGSWEFVETLTLSGNLPLAADFDDLFIYYVAIRMSPRHGQVAAPTTIALYDALVKQAKARYKQTQATAVADPRVSESQQSFGGLGWYE